MSLPSKCQSEKEVPHNKTKTTPLPFPNQSQKKDPGLLIPFS